MVPNITEDHCNDCVDRIKQTYWNFLAFLVHKEIQQKGSNFIQDNRKLTICLEDLLNTQDKYRTDAYWLWHDLLDILDVTAPGDQDWIDEISVEEEIEKIIKVILQPGQFCQTCWYWLDLIFNGIDEVDR